MREAFLTSQGTKIDCRLQRELPVMFKFYQRPTGMGSGRIWIYPTLIDSVGSFDMKYSFEEAMTDSMLISIRFTRT